MKFIDHIIYADYWTRTKLALVLGAFTLGAGMAFIGHRSWGWWPILLAVLLFITLLAFRRKVAEPAREEAPWWVSTAHWDYRIKIAVLLLAFGLGPVTDRFLVRHPRPDHGIVLGIVLASNFLVLFVMQSVFPEHPRPRKS